MPCEPFESASLELAGLEPATSWVRFRRKPLPPFANLAGSLNREALARGALPLFAPLCRG